MQCDCPAKQLLIVGITCIRGRNATKQPQTWNAVTKGITRGVNSISTLSERHQQHCCITQLALQGKQSPLTNGSKTPQKRKLEGGGGVLGPNFDNGHIAYCTQTPHIYSHETASKTKAGTKKHEYFPNGLQHVTENRLVLVRSTRGS